MVLNSLQQKVDIFYKDIWELFQRIKILMQYGCVGYVMRHEDYHNAPVSNFYVQIADGVTSSSFTKMSFGQFVIEINLIGKKRH